MNIRTRKLFDYTSYLLAVNSQPIIDNPDRIKFLVHHKMINEELYSKAVELYRIADSIYPGECDLQLSLSGRTSPIKYSIALIIHFPKLTVKNNSDNKIDIRDIFFKMDLVTTHGKITIAEMMGQRTTFSYAEYAVAYRFSHMSSNAFNLPPDWLSLCFGDGDLPILKTQFNQTAENDKLRTPVFTMMMLAIENYYSWESLEGGPYQKMQNIGNMVTKWNTNSLSIFDTNTFSEHILSEKSFIDYDIFFKDNVLKIADNDKLNKSITIAAQRRRLSGNIFYRKSQSGELFLESAETLTAKLTEIPIIFRQKLYYYKVEDINITLDKSTLYINPLIKNNVRRKIEFSINSKAIGSGLIKRLQDQSEID